MDNGVAKIQSFTINGPQFSVEGQGQVDLGNQYIDFRFLPKPTGSRATGLAQYGVPLKFTGPFGSAKAGLDSDFLTQIVAAQAKEKAAALVQEQLGGQLGGVLGGVIGGGQSGTSSGLSGDNIGGVLGGVLGGGQQQSGTTSNGGSFGGQLGGLLGGGSQSTQQPSSQGTTTQQQPAQQPSVEDALGGAIGGLFGKKKKKKN